ncbi:MAG: hypothetical protein ACE5I4_05185 [Thermoplasmata archaeon]
MVGINAYLALGSAIVSGVFAGMVFRQFAAKRKVYQLAWGIGLALFTLASSIEFISEVTGGWTVSLYKSYVVLHPTLVAVLGLGTVYLLASKKVGHAFLAYIIVFFPIFLFLIVTAPIAVSESQPDRILCGEGAEQAVCQPGRVVGDDALTGIARRLSFFFNIPGAAALIGGAVYSWYRTRWSYNLLIAAGAGLMATGGTLTTLGQAELLYIFLLIGIAIMFVGFLRSLEVSRAPRPEPVPSSAQ